MLLVLTLILPMAALADGPDLRTVTVVSTNDFHGALIGRVHSWSHGDVVGSSDWVAGYINVVRDKQGADEVLLLDAGDIMQGTLISNYFYGASTIDIYNEMGYNAAAIGNHEFDWGQDVLVDRVEQADFPFLAANIFYNDLGPAPGERPDWAMPYTTNVVNDVTVGIIGIANPETPSITNPANVANLEFTDPAVVVMDLVDDVEAEGATIIIVLAHMGGFYPLSEGDEVYNLAMGLDPEDIDLIVSGHTHSGLYDQVNDIPIMQAYSGGTAIGRIDLIVEKASGEVADVKEFSVTSTYNTWYGGPAEYDGVVVVPDPEVEAIVDYYEAEIADVLNEVVGETTTDITRDSCHESAMGDWVTDIMRAYDADGDPTTVDIDFAFTNSGGLRANIDSGEIIYGEVFETIPFDNTLVLATVNGEELKAVLEEGVGPGDRYCGGTLEHGIIQVSGLKFNWDSSQSAYNRVSNVRYYDDSPVDLGTEATYTIAVNDFIASGADDYPTLPTLPQINTYEIIREIVADWVRATSSPFTPPDPAAEGRITP